MRENLIGESLGQNQRKTKRRPIASMIQDAAKIATDMTRLITGQDLIKKAIESNRHYEKHGSERKKLSSKLKSKSYFSSTYDRRY